MRIALGLAVAGLLVACGHPSAQNAQREMRGAVDGFFRTLVSHDWDGAARWMAPEFKLFSDGAEIYDRATYVELLRQDDLDVTAFRLSEFESSVSDDGTLGWVRYRAAVRATSRGRPANVNTAETMILARRGGSWLIVQAHASIRPAENGTER